MIWRLNTVEAKSGFDHDHHHHDDYDHDDYSDDDDYDYDDKGVYENLAITSPVQVCSNSCGLESLLDTP